MPSCLNSLQGLPNSLALPPVRKVVVLLVDGLGTAPLKARAGHSRTLAPMVVPATTIGSGFPSTTAAALATLTTGVQSGEHGLVGYTALDTNNDRVVNQLSGWDDMIDPATWQRARTQFEVAQDIGIPSFAIGAARYLDSGFTRAVLRGAEYHTGISVGDRFAQARSILDSTDPALIYLYVPELDQAAHKYGSGSEQWIMKLEELDAAVATFAKGLRPDEGMLLTADHGMIDVQPHNHILFDQIPGLLDGVRHIAGEPRCVQLHFEPDADEALRAEVLERWRQSEQERAWVTTRDEAIEAGWFGPSVHPSVVPRIGDILVAARKAIAYYDSRSASASARAMVGQHGSLSPQEASIPLLRFGAYARR